jgi:flagellar hook-associated protein 1 FlgK
MPDLLGTSLTGMLAFQRAMEMTGHNIANANTPGYSRQVAEFSTRVGQGSGNGFIGSGTQITTIKRIYDEMLGEQLQSSMTSHARFSTLNSLTTKIDGMLADPDTGLSSSMQSFFDSLQDLANDPSSIPARQAVLGEASGIIQRFQTLGGQINQLDGEVNQRISLAVDDINRLADSIADINDDIVLAAGRTGQPPNDLLDQRDLMVRQLSEQISVTTVMQDDGSMNVYMGAGQSLVTGNAVKHLAVTGSEFDPTKLEVVYLGASGNSSLDSTLTGGTIGGLLEFRSKMLDPSKQALGETALALAVGFNQQHTSGMDLRGAMGGEFFGIDAPTILSSTRNTGTGNASAVVSDISAFTGEDLVLEYDGAAYSLTRASDGQAVSMTGSGTAIDPFVAEGLSFTMAGSPAAGDRLMIRPARDIATSIDVLVNDASSIAMASPVRVAVADANLGDATVGNTSVVDSGDPGLLATSVIEFTSATTFSVNGAGSFPYVSSDLIQVNGASFQINGNPAPGDRFTLGANFGAVGDNSNGLLLANVQSNGILSGGSLSINESYGQLVANVGSTTHQVQANLDVQSVILANTEAAYQSNSGVNLDEEAANLIRYQQAYQAVAQVVAVANTIFDSLLNATRR